MAQSVWTGGSHHTGLAALPHENIHRTKFHYVDEEYDEVIRVNFRESNARQSDIRIDPTTVSHFMRGHRNNPTIKTICEIADGANLSVSDLLKTVQDKELDKRIKENDK